MEKALKFLSQNKATYYEIFDGDGDRLFKANENSIEETTELFEEHYDFLQDGTYKIVARQKENTPKSQQSIFRFTKGQPQEKETKTFQKMSSTPGAAMYTLEQIREIEAAAEKRGEEKARITILEDKVTRLEKNLTDLVKYCNDKFDELDGTKDNDFMSTAKSIIGDISEAAGAMQNFKM
jgi:hypothetical protein